MVSAGSYILCAVALAAVVLSLGFSAFCLRRRLLGAWTGAPARLVEAMVGVALLIWLSELLGSVGLFRPWALIAASLLLTGGLYAALARGAGSSGESPAGEAEAGGSRTPPPAGGPGPARGPGLDDGGTRRQVLSGLVALAVVAAVVFHWAVTTKHALDRGIFNFDSLWYHMPFAVDMVQSHSVTGMHHVETVFTNWFYPQNSELLHAVGILLTNRDTLSLFLNFGWLAVALLAAWCIGRPFGRGHLTVVAAAILLDCHTLVVRDPGAAKNDLAAAALVLASIAILIEAWSRAHPQKEDGQGGGGAGGGGPAPPDERGERATGRPHLPPGWALAAAGLAAGLAAGTRVTALAMVAALSLAVVVLAPAGRRLAASGWWFGPLAAGGAFWYLRNLIVAGNPIPEITSLGPIGLPHPERLQEGRPDFSIAHYATDTAVWRDYFEPGLHAAFGALWPVVVLGAAVAAFLALVWGRDRMVRWIGGVALFGLLAYLFTPLSAAGAEGEPVGFGINIRYVVPALLGGIVLAPLPRFLDDRRRQWVLLGALVAVFLITNRPDDALHDKARIFALLFVAVAVLIPAALLAAPRRGVGTRALLAAGAVLALVIIAIGYPLQRHYLQERFRNEVASEALPGMDLDSTYRWARGIRDARIGLAGTTAGFAGYGLYGTGLSNRVRYLGSDGPHGAFNAIPGCAAFRAAVNAADLDYLVTSPFLNFLHPDRPVGSPEARWLRGEPAVSMILRSGPVAVWEVRGQLDPSGCGAANAPLREIPNTPTG